MRFTDIHKNITERADDKKIRLAKLYNQRAELRDQIRMAREEQDQAKLDQLEAKLGRLEDTIEDLSESASPLAAAKAKLAQLKADFGDLPKNPTNQDQYDAIDDLRDEITKQENKVKMLSEAPNQDPTQAFEEAQARAVAALQNLGKAIDHVGRVQRRNARDWGYVGTMQNAAFKLEELLSFMSYE